MRQTNPIPPEVRQRFYETLTVLIVSEMADSLCGLVDGIFISRYYGATAIAAHGVASPLFTFLCILSYLLSASLQHKCIVSIGQKDIKSANGYFNIALFLAAGICSILTLIGMFMPDLAATMLGSGSGPIKPLASEYIRGVAPGTIPIVLFIILVPILQIEGKWILIQIGSIAMALIDITLDYLNVKYFMLGMYGMGLATSISYIIGMLIFLVYFLGKKRIFRIRTSDMKGLNFYEFVSTGMPTGTRMVARMLSLVFITFLVVRTSGHTAMAAMGVQRNISDVVLSMIVGLSGAVLSITSVSYGKKDKAGLRYAVRLGYTQSFGVIGIFAVLLFIFSPNIVSVYLPRADASYSMAVTAVRWLAVSMPLVACNWSFASYIHGLGMIKGATFVFVSGELGVLCITAFIMSNIWGINGIFASFAVAQFTTLVAILISRYRYRRKHPYSE